MWITVTLGLAQVGVMLRAILRPHREPSSRLAWSIVILTAPVVGMVAYLLLGEARISSKRRELGRRIDESICRPSMDERAAEDLAAGHHAAPFALGRTINNLAPSSRNHAELMADSNSAIDGMIADIDGARSAVHICFYIWLADRNGLKLKDAAIRAAKRGVAVRVLADSLGSRAMIRSAHWQDMHAAGVQTRVALPVGNLLWTMIRGRVDLRNHRKSLIVDNTTGWCGSQNAADPEFLVKRKFAPWVDVMTRWQGDVVRDMQFIFVSDWLAETGEDLSALLEGPANPPCGDVYAQVVGTGPSLEYAAMSACFSSLIHSARHEIVITTPYFVPDEQVLFAILTAARRGVKTVLILPSRCDSRLVAAASRSHYANLLQAGVELYEFSPGLLHAKTIVVDRMVGLIGSANIDRRSFELNFENNVLFQDAGFAAMIRQRQSSYLQSSVQITRRDADSASMLTKIWRNSLAMFAPLL